MEHALRTNLDVIDTYGRLCSEPINGIKNVSCLVSTQNFNLIDSFAIDQMHCIHLGVMKKLLNLAF